MIARHDPRMVIALGDSFHDREAHGRLSAPDRDAIAGLQARRDWIWISGNHDPALPSDLGGVVASEVAIGPIAFRHEPTGAAGEIAGHLHPKARVSTRGRSMERRCFASDGERAVMPAFGAYTGGLSHPRRRRLQKYSRRWVSWPMCSAMSACIPSPPRAATEASKS